MHTNKQARSSEERRSPNSRQVGGNHYAASIQHWDIVAMHGLDYFQGNITKYVMRWKKKGGIQDLEKAKHYLEKYISLETENAKHTNKNRGPNKSRVSRRARPRGKRDDAS